MLQPLVPADDWNCLKGAFSLSVPILIVTIGVTVSPANLVCPPQHPFWLAGSLKPQCLGQPRGPATRTGDLYFRLQVQDG